MAQSMEDYEYLECCKPQQDLGGKVDGCQLFVPQANGSCRNCGCPRFYHRFVKKPVVVYTKCQKIIEFTTMSSVDGCQEFKPCGHDSDGGTAEAALTCAICGCHRNFHLREQITK